MRIKLLFILFLIITELNFGQDKNEIFQQRIIQVENGLIEFKFGPPDTSQNQKTFTLADRMIFYNVPGVSVAIINDNKIEWTKAYGKLSSSGKSPVTIESYFEAASTTKMLVAAVVLHFVEKRMLDLDKDVNNYLMSWKIKENVFTKQKKVTLRMLLTHQSGLPMTNFPYEDGKIPTLVQVLNGELPAKNKPAIVDTVPGSTWQYSNIGYDVIQLILEDMTGKPLQQIMDEIIFTPLEMKSSALLYPLKKEQQKNEALPHDKDGKVCEPAMHPTAIAQGGLMTTPNDLAIFTNELIKAYNGESKKILSRELIKIMFHPELDLNPAIMGVPIAEGLGVFIQNKGKDFAFGHPGENYPGTTCWLMAVPSLGKGVVIMTNSANGFPLAMEIYSAIKKAYNWPEGL